MKFDQQYVNILREMDVSGVFGSAAGDGDMSTGWTAGDSAYPAMGIFGGVKKKRKKKRKQSSKRKKRVKKIGEDGQIAYSKGPVQAGNITMQRRPSIGRMTGINESQHDEPEVIEELLPALGAAGAMLGKGALAAGKMALPVAKTIGRGALALGGKALQGAGNLAAKAGTAAAATGAQTAAAALGTEEGEAEPDQAPARPLDQKQLDILAATAVAPLNGLDKANFDKVYQKIMQSLNQMKASL